MTSSDRNSTRTCWRPCWTTTVSFSDSRISSKCLNKKPNRGVFLFRKSYHRRRRSSLKRPRRWLTNTAGSSLLTPASVPKMQTPTHSCSLSLKSCQTKKLIDISTRPWWSFQQKFFKLLLTNPIFPNSRKKSTDFSDRMLSIFLRELSMMKPERENTNASKKLVQLKKEMNFLKGWKIDLRFQKKTTDRAISKPKMKSDHCLTGWRHMELLTQDHHWFQWFSQVWKTKRRCSEMSRIRLKLVKAMAKSVLTQCTLKEMNLKRLLNRRRKEETLMVTENKIIYNFYLLFHFLYLKFLIWNNKNMHVFTLLL